MNEELEKREKYIRDVFLDIMGEEIILNKGIQKLGGMNNNNYKILTDENQYVFRLPGKGSNESVNRKSELFNSKLAYEIGINCTTVYFDHKTGLKVTEYIEDAETLSIETAKIEENIQLMADTLNILHNNEKKFYRDFRPFREMEAYKETIFKEEEGLFKNYPELDRTIAFLKEEVERMKIDYVPCHLDAWPENFVKGKDKIYLIDWEYSANYDRLWDVVSIGLECSYTEDEENLFYQKYFNGQPTDSQLEKMDLLRVLMDIYWSMWALSKVSCGEESLTQYSYERYKRGLSNLNRIDS